MGRGPSILRLPAARAVVVVALGLVLTALLNAQSLRKTAHGQPAGVARAAALAVTEPLAWVSNTLYLDRPRRGVQRLVGRSDADRIDATVRVAAPPTSPPAVGSPRHGAGPGVSAPTTAGGPAGGSGRSSADSAAGKPGGTPGSADAAKPAFGPARPLRVWVAGDSLVVVPGRSLQRAASRMPAVAVIGLEGRLATGLTRPDVYNWFTRFSSVMSDQRPDVVVLSFGSNDAHHFMSGVPAGRSLGEFGSQEWIQEYRRRIRAVNRAFAAAGTYVVWLGLPRARSETRNPRLRVLNRIVGQVADGDERSLFVDTWTLLTDGRGGYSDYLPNGAGGRVRIRAVDGVHYTAAGGDMIAAVILQRLGHVFDFGGRSGVRGG